MDIRENQSPNNILVQKPAATTHFMNKYTLTERKLLNVCLWNAQEKGLNRAVHSIPSNQVRQLIGAGDTRNYSWLRDASRGLVSKIIEWNSTGKDQANEWGVCTFLASGVIRGGNLRYRLNPELVERIQNPRLWGRFGLLAQVNIKRKNALVIYEFLSTELSIAGSKTQEINLEVSLSDIRETCGMTDGQYASYKDFNRYVLAPAKKEINEKTDLLMSYEGKKKGRAIHSLVFNVQRKEFFQYPLPGLDFPIPVKSMVHEDAKEDDIASLLLSAGISRRQTNRLISKYSAERIERNVAYSKARADKTAIKNISAYIVKAIEGDYQPEPSANEISKKEQLLEKAEKRKILEAKQAAKKALENEFAEYQNKRMREIFDSRSRSWQHKKRKEFESSLSENDIILGYINSEGWEKSIVHAAFFNSLRDDLLTAKHEISLDAFKKWKGAKKAA